MKRSAFSLVELSIVLVILGLLTGGILAGQSLIQASQMRSVINDMAKYKTAMNMFRDKYFYLPGDVPNAVRFWGAQAGGTGDGRDGTCANLTTQATNALTCNGNGDGYINYGGSSADGYERYRAWQHMANAGLIEGSYGGAYMTGTGYSWRSSIAGVNIPASRIANVGYSFDNAVSSNEFNFIDVGSLFISSGTALETAYIAFKNEDVWNMDTKMDDGRPNSGKIRTPAYAFFNAYCQSSAAADSDYNLSRNDNVCWFKFYPMQ